MADILSPAERSRVMSLIRAKDTKPELTIRKGLHRLGFRYRLHDGGLPGKPDLVLRRYRAVIFVHGCFWHGHDCHLFRWPKTRQEWWRDKIGRTRQRDAKNRELLRLKNLRQAHVWECSLRGKSAIGLDHVMERLARWLRGNRRLLEIRGKK